MISGFLGFSQSELKQIRNKTVTFPNGDESITIIAKENTNLIKLGNNESYKRFDILELYNHEARHSQLLLEDSKGGNKNNKGTGVFAVHSKGDRPREKEQNSEKKGNQDS